MSNVGTLTKSLLAAGGSIAIAAIAAGKAAMQNDGRIDGLEWLGLIAALLTGLAVWAKSNDAEGLGYWWKAIITAVGGLVTGLVTSLAGNDGRSIGELFGNMTFDQWILLVVAPAFNALLVAVAPNAVVSDDPPQPGGDDEPDPDANDDDIDDPDEVEGVDVEEVPSDYPAATPEDGQVI